MDGFFSPKKSRKIENQRLLLSEKVENRKSTASSVQKKIEK
jgi:hypothetical protein